MTTTPSQDAMRAFHGHLDTVWPLWRQHEGNVQYSLMPRTWTASAAHATKVAAEKLRTMQQSVECAPDGLWDYYTLDRAIENITKGT